MRENKSKPIIYFMLTGMLVLIAGVVAVFGLSSGIRIIKVIRAPYLDELQPYNIFIDEFDNSQKLYLIDYDAYERNKFTEPDLDQIAPPRLKLLVSCLAHNKINPIRNAGAAAQYIGNIKHYDPDNGWYDMILAILLFMDDSPEALKYYYQAFEKMEFNEYSQERLAVKENLFGSKPNFRNVLRQIFLRYDSDSSSVHCHLNDIGKKITDTATRLIKENKPEEAEKLLDSYAKFLILWVNDSSNFELYCTMQCIGHFKKELPKLYLKINRPDKAKLAGDKLSEIIRLDKKANDKISIIYSSNRKFYETNRKKNGYLLDWLPLSFKIDRVMTSARRKIDYIIAEKLVIMLLTVILFLFSVSIFTVLVINSIRSPSENPATLPDFKITCLVISVSLVLPTALWLLTGSIPAINGKNVNILSNALGFSCQCLLLMTTAITIPWLCSAFFSNNTCKRQKYPVRNVNLFVSVNLIAVLFIPCILAVLVMENHGVMGSDFLQRGLYPFVPHCYHNLRNPPPCIWCSLHSRAVFGIFALLLLLVPIEVVTANIITYALKRKKHPENTRLLFAMAAPLYAIAAIFFYVVFIPHYERFEAETIIKGDLLNVDRETDMDQENLQRDTCKKIIEILRK